MGFKICCFTGHRIIEDDEMLRLPSALGEVIDELYKRGVREFRAGGAIGFDTIAALKVISFRVTHPDVRLVLMLPCRDQDSRWPAYDREIYSYVLSCADSVIYTDNVYVSGCMHRRNRALVRGSHFCVAYVNQTDGGSAYTMELASREGLEVINLANKQTRI